MSKSYLSIYLCISVSICQSLFIFRSIYLPNMLSVWFRRLSVQSGASVRQRWQKPSEAPPPAASVSSLPQHPARAVSSRGPPGLTCVPLLRLFQSSGRRHQFRPQPLVQPGPGRHRPHQGVPGLGVGARRHLPGLLAPLLRQLWAQQRQREAERGVTRPSDVRPKTILTDCDSS